MTSAALRPDTRRAACLTRRATMRGDVYRLGVKVWVHESPAISRHIVVSREIEAFADLVRRVSLLKLIAKV